MKNKDIIKDVLKIFSIGMVIYFFLGLLFSYYLGIYKYFNVLFDIDTPRVFNDLVDFSANHYRTSVHPLFVIYFMPLCKVLSFILNDQVLGVLLLQSFFASISLIGVYSFLNKLGLNKKIVVLLTLVFGLSYGQIVFSSSIETYIFAQGFLVLLWLFSLYKVDKKFSLLDYIILVILGVSSLAITITNFIQYIVAVFFIVTLNKKEDKRFLKTIIVGIVVLAISVLIATVQNIIWPSAPNFFCKLILDFVNNTSEETLYMDKTMNFSKVINCLNAIFAYSFNLGKLYIPKTGVYMTFMYSEITNIISIIMALSFIVLNCYYIIKTKFSIMKDRIYYALLISLIFNFLLHLIYGNSIAFLYICHFNFLIILIIGYILAKLKINLKGNIIIIILAILYTGLACYKIVEMFLLLCPRYNALEYIRLLVIVMFFVLFMFMCVMVFKNNLLKVIFILLSGIIIFGGTKYYNNLNAVKEVDSNSIEFYEKQLNVYKKQLKEMKNSFMVGTYEDTDDKIGIMFFGMADRRKMIYKKGVIYDAYTEEVIKKINYDEELIVPNEYSVILKKENNIYRIVENEKGVYFYENDTEEILSEGDKIIKLPGYEEYKYSEILKVLHQEILFNINGSEPLPNIFGYKQAYYRDAMLVTMVLEDTNNVDLIKDWVKDIDKIYDNSRSPDINEADNLGELLYIIGATKVDKKNLVDKILKEINRLKDEDGYISGMVDGSIQTYYPTVVAKYGALKNNIELDLNYPVVDDGYTGLTWYSDYKIARTNEQSSSYFPYINWGFYHYSNYGSLYILDEIYPLSYEGGEDNPDYFVKNECFISDFYCRKDLYLAHSWAASEMYLFLKDFK